MNFAFNVPVNAVSFGQCSTALLKETFKKGLSPCVFPMMGNVDLSAQKPDQDFGLWLQSCINKAPRLHNRNNIAIRLWHLSDLLSSYSKEQIGITFLETDTCTETEANVANQQKTLFVTSNYTKQVMEDAGVKTVKYLELGFDKDNFYDTKKSYLNKNITVWGLFGKLEPNRKRHIKILKNWIAKYGNNREHVLHAALWNVFLKPEDQANILNQALEGKKYWNINFIPGVKTNAEYNDIVNSIDIVISCSGGEGRDLPSFHAVGLGKHCLGLRAHAYLDYLNDENAVLIEPNSKIKAADGMFFHESGLYNLGNFFDWSDEDFLNGMELVYKRHKTNRLNIKGLELQNRTWATTLETILKEI